jgi:hypothetical protein
MAAPMPEPEEDEAEMPEGDEPEGDGEDAEYETAGRAIREAISTGTDADLAEAICHLIDLHTGEGGEEPGGEEPESKPNLAAILLAKKPPKKGKKD